MKNLIITIIIINLTLSFAKAQKVGLPSSTFSTNSNSKLLAHIQSNNTGNFGKFDKQWIGIGQPISDAYGLRIQWRNNAGILALTGTGADKKLELNWGGPNKKAKFQINNITDFKDPNAKKNCLTILPNGSIGIGFTVPESKLEVKGYIRSTSSKTRNNRITIGHGNSHSFIDANGIGNLYFRHTGQNLMGIKKNGKVFIGNVSTPSNNYRLFVDKGILTEKVRVAVKDSDDWADYVFENDYDLMPISELQNYIALNKHLPNVPSAEEVVEHGIDMAQMDATLLEKIEEAHLYIIELKKEIEGLKTQISNKL